MKDPIYETIGGTMWCSQYTALDAAGGHRSKFLLMSLHDRAREMLRVNGVNGRGRYFRPGTLRDLRARLMRKVARSARST